ncbi:MAG: SDR family oxidoreductase [Bacteroidota bacterium]
MKWAFIIGGSSGFGLATAQLLGNKGYNLFIIHRDRKGNLPTIESNFNEIRKNGNSVVSMNINANDKMNHASIIEKLKETIGNGQGIQLFLHSLADGNVKPIISADHSAQPQKTLSTDDFEHTINAMGISFITWSKLLFENKLFAGSARIIGITSEGTNKVMKGYAAVAASKSVLESACRYLAVELAPFGITTNLIKAGITETPALIAIPGFEKLLERARSKNPSGRLTTTRDVANVIYLLARDEAAWINGAIIRVDGGEQIVA